MAKLISINENDGVDFDLDAADGDFDKDEIVLVKGMCSVLGMNPADFKL